MNGSYNCSVSRISVSILAMFAWHTPATAANRGPDFDNDNIDDVALGVPKEDVGTLTDAGLVNVLYGSASGLVDPVNRFTSIWRDLSLSGQTVAGASTKFDGFGQDIAWGDFDGDCFDDLAVAVFSGDLHAFYGSTTGLNFASGQMALDDRIVLTEIGLPTAIAAGDFNGDGFDDVAMGGFLNESVDVVYGSIDGLVEDAGPGHQEWSIDSEGIVGTDPVAAFGFALATGDFNCDGKDDLAIGAPDEDEVVGGTTEPSSGRVHVLYGSSNGLTATGSQVWGQQITGVDGVGEEDDFFGKSLAVGNFNNDTANNRPCHDLAVGVPGEGMGTPPTEVTRAGAVSVLYGSSTSGLQTSTPSNVLWHRGVSGVAGDPQGGDNFGADLVAGNMDSDDFEDLAIGAPGNGGSVSILRGSSTGIVTTGNLMWDQDTPGVDDDLESGDEFGVCLGYGREWLSSLDRGLAVCAPKEDHSSLTDPGRVHFLYLQNTSTPQIAADGSYIQSEISPQSNEGDDRFATSIAAPRDRPFTSEECD